MFKLHAKLVAPLSAVLFALSLSPATYADVIAPALEIDSDGAGDYISGSASDLTIDGTVRSIISDFGPPPVVVDIPDVDFLLTADGNGNNGVDYFYTNGTISAGSYLNTTFSSMTISPFMGMASFSAVLDNGGTIEGAFIYAGDFSSGFMGYNLIAKAGPVVPVPAAVWLMGSGLLGLVAVGRRRRQSA